MATILVVEDEAPNVEILKRLLSLQGHNVLVAGNKDRAIDSSISENVDLILMDIGIPDADGQAVNKDGGLEATRRIKSNPITDGIPIIATTASAMLDERKKFLEAGCDDVQSKPFDFASLIASISAQLNSDD